MEKKFKEKIADENKFHFALIIFQRTISFHSTNNQQQKKSERDSFQILFYVR